LCTAYATRWNPLTGAQLKNVADEAGYALGILSEQPRPMFAATYKRRAADIPPRPIVAGEFVSQLDRPLQLVLAGTAGERVQTAASLLATSAMRAGLHTTQKNDNPVTQGTGFSVSELILSPDEILFTGIEKPDALLIVSDDGARELGRNGVFEEVGETTLVLSDDPISLPDLPSKVLRFPFRRLAGPKLAATAAVLAWLSVTRMIPLEAFWAALEARFGKETQTTQATLQSFLEQCSFAEFLPAPQAPGDLSPQPIVAGQTKRF
jgi:Pyruvate/2-oxoacid:ferredoxin oxidoreductase gamma subunit